MKLYEEVQKAHSKCRTTRETTAYLQAWCLKHHKLKPNSLVRCLNTKCADGVREWLEKVDRTNSGDEDICSVERWTVGIQVGFVRRRERCMLQLETDRRSFPRNHEFVSVCLANLYDELQTIDDEELRNDLEYFVGMTLVAALVRDAIHKMKGTLFEGKIVEVGWAGGDFFPLQLK